MDVPVIFQMCICSVYIQRAQRTIRLVPFLQHHLAIAMCRSISSFYGNKYILLYNLGNLDIRKV